MMDTEPPYTTDVDRDQRAREYETLHNRLYGVRLGLTVLLVAVYLLSGSSAELATGLQARFGAHWWWTNAVYLLVTFFAFAALLFPLSWYGDYHLEHRYGLSNQNLNGWLADYIKSMVIELLLGTAFFSVIYALLHFSPHWWWLWATGVYVLLSVVLSALWPVWIMPLFHSFEELKESELTAAMRRFVEAAGLQVVGVYRWGLEEKSETANAALTGLGRTRRIILSDTMLDNYDREEIIAVLAHEAGHYKHGDMWRLMAIGTVLAAAGFYLADVVLHALVDHFGFAGVAEIGAFPIFIFALLVFSVISMPLGNAYSRRREYAADAYAVQATGSAEPLVSALTKLADQNLADKEPAAWIEFLLHSHPSIARRIQRARGEKTD